jgi:hypothetical protein
VAALIWLFKSDEACKDASRFFYGMGENGQVIVLGNQFPNNAIDELLKDHETALAPKLQQQAQRQADSISTFSAGHNTAQDRGQMYAQQAIDTAVKIIYDSYPPKGKESGTRHLAAMSAAVCFLMMKLARRSKSR